MSGARDGLAAAAGVALQGVGPVSSFPGEIRLFAAEVAIGRGGAIDWPVQVEHFTDAIGRQVEMPAHKLVDPLWRHLARAEGVHADGSRLGDADGI